MSEDGVEGGGDVESFFQEGSVESGDDEGQRGYVEDAISFHLKINDTAASSYEIDGKRPFADIIRDYSNSNLDKVELFQLRILNKLYELCKEIKAYGSAQWVLRDIFTILNTSRGKNGFERRMTVSQFTHGTVKQEQTMRQDRPSGLLSFNRKKKGNNDFSQTQGGF